MMTNTIEKTVEVRADIHRVWRAITDHEEFGAWFGVRLDGPFVAGQAATGRITHPGYEHVEWQARIEKIEKPHLFSFHWHPYGIDPDIDYSREPPTLVEFRLEPTAHGTRVTVIESGFDAIPKSRMPEAFRMNEEGWTAQMKNIADYLEREDGD